MKCDGGCEDLGGHSGNVRLVHVWGFYIPKDDALTFNYCDTAIAEDRERGFTVEESNRHD